MNCTLRLFLAYTKQVYRTLKVPLNKQARKDRHLMSISLAVLPVKWAKLGTSCFLLKSEVELHSALPFAQLREVSRV